MKKLLFTACLLSIATSSIATYEMNNEPRWILGNSYETNLSKLPESASLDSETIPWANSFWPHIYGGIAFRWNNYYTETPDFAKYHSEISEIKDEISELRKSIFVREMNENQARNTISQIHQLEKRMSTQLLKKKALHQQYFFTVKRYKANRQALTFVDYR